MNIIASEPLRVKDKPYQNAGFSTAFRQMIRTVPNHFFAEKSLKKFKNWAEKDKSV